MADVAAATDAAGAGATSGAAPAGALAYPHLWFDDQGRPWIDDTNTKVIELVLDHTAARRGRSGFRKPQPFTAGYLTQRPRAQGKLL